ncbi:hypothetical protein GCM10020220_070240 [Nonomuraea rubra]|uniref:hypothetical protein n=1 Tax=Nonomuraea rubra TaxID=46180 RepID=UPI0031E6E094
MPGWACTGGPAHSLVMTGGALDRAAGRLQFARGLGYVLGPALAATLWAAEGFGRAGVGHRRSCLRSAPPRWRRSP